jgi:transcriptional regulator with XRE-family HTH domain
VDNIGQRLREERTLRGWSQRDLARETGVNTDTISGIETGQHEPRPSTLRKLAQGLGIEVRDLFAEPVLPKAEAPAPGRRKEVAAQAAERAEELVGQVAEQAEELIGQVAEEAAEAASGAGDETEYALSELDYGDVLYLEHADEVGEWVHEITNQADLRGKRLEIIVHEDNSAEIRIKPMEPSTSTKRAAKRTGKYVVTSAKGGRFVVTRGEKRSKRKTDKGERIT